MAQGFKAKAPKKAASTNTRKKLQPKDLKKGAKVIPPKKAVVKAQTEMKKKHSASHTVDLERNIAAQAGARGKLTIMKPVASSSSSKDS